MLSIKAKATLTILRLIFIVGGAIAASPSETAAIKDTRSGQALQEIHGTN